MDTCGYNGHSIFPYEKNVFCDSNCGERRNWDDFHYALFSFCWFPPVLDSHNFSPSPLSRLFHVSPFRIDGISNIRISSMFVSLLQIHCEFATDASNRTIVSLSSRSDDFILFVPPVISATPTFAWRRREREKIWNDSRIEKCAATKLDIHFSWSSWCALQKTK